MGIKNLIMGLYAVPWTGGASDDSASSVENCIAAQHESMALALAIPDFDEPASNFHGEPIYIDAQFSGND